VVGAHLTHHHPQPLLTKEGSIPDGAAGKYWSINFLVCSFAPLPLGEGSGVRENTAKFLLQYLCTPLLTKEGQGVVGLTVR